jgi:rhodanese-related sulfurtransferase
MRLHPDKVSSRAWQLLFICSVTMTLFFFITSAVQANTDQDKQKRDRVIAMYNEYTKDFPGVKDITSEEALQLLPRGDVVFVDVRKAKEQKVSMIPGAVTKKHFLKNLEEYRDKKIIAYCTISYRSGKFAEKMEKKGVTITNLQAGLLGWVHAHGPLMHENEPAMTLHVYGKTWDLGPSWITTVF